MGNAPYILAAIITLVAIIIAVGKKWNPFGFIPEYLGLNEDDDDQIYQQLHKSESLNLTGHYHEMDGSGATGIKYRSQITAQHLEPGTYYRHRPGSVWVKGCFTRFFENGGCQVEINDRPVRKGPKNVLVVP
jgi:hypothetical protein